MRTCKPIAPGVLGHRLIIRPEAEVEGKRTLDVVRELIEMVPILDPANQKLGRKTRG